MALKGDGQEADIADVFLLEDEANATAHRLSLEAVTTEDAIERMEWHGDRLVWFLRSGDVIST